MNDEFIQLVCKKLGVTQKELATKMNVSQAMVSKWKHGEPIKGKHRVTLSDLLDIEEGLLESYGFIGDDHDLLSWEVFFRSLAEKYDLGAVEFNTYGLSGNHEPVATILLQILRTAGVWIPEIPPGPALLDENSRELSSYDKKTKLFGELVCNWGKVCSNITSYFNDTSFSECLPDVGKMNSFESDTWDFTDGFLEWSFFASIINCCEEESSSNNFYEIIEKNEFEVRSKVVKKEFKGKLSEYLETCKELGVPVIFEVEKLLNDDFQYPSYPQKEKENISPRDRLFDNIYQLQKANFAASCSVNKKLIAISEAMNLNLTLEYKLK